MYLLSQDGEIYQNRISMIPNWFTRLAWRLGMIEVPYSKEQLEEGERIALSGALVTIEALNNPKAIAERRELKRRIKHEKKKNNCIWQTREVNGGPHFMCLTHEQLVPMEDGIEPKHK